MQIGELAHEAPYLSMCYHRILLVSAVKHVMLMYSSLPIYAVVGPDAGMARVWLWTVLCRLFPMMFLPLQLWLESI